MDLPSASVSVKSGAATRLLTAMRFCCAGAAGEMLCQRAMEQSTQRCARTRGAGAAAKAKAISAAAVAMTAAQLQ